jgi:hypothetical protein
MLEFFFLVRFILVLINKFCWKYCKMLHNSPSTYFFLVCWLLICSFFGFICNLQSCNVQFFFLLKQPRPGSCVERPHLSSAQSGGGRDSSPPVRLAYWWPLSVLLQEVTTVNGVEEPVTAWAGYRSLLCCLKGTVARDFRPPLFSIKRTYLGPWFIF